jgi:hypothetical protein
MVVLIRKSLRPAVVRGVLILVLTQLAWLAAAPAVVAQVVPDRRQDQFSTEPGYLFIPLPYSLPGLGAGLGALAYLTNVGETHTDLFGFYIGGDVTGYGIGFSQLHLLPDHLLLEAEHEQFNSAQIFQYSTRGMDTGKNEYELVDFESGSIYYGQLALVAFDRRLELFYQVDSFTGEITGFRDKDGKLLQKIPGGLADDSTTYTYGLVLDLTDDRFDPRKGVRGILSSAKTPRDTKSDPEFSVVNAQVDVYIPIGQSSTWAFDFFHSQAVVQSRGETDPAVIVQDVCPPGDTACESSPAAQAYVANTLAANQNGTSESLGGQHRMRAYPGGRFNGAYTEYAGTELRIALTDEVTPFDYFIWKDKRTAIQLALIYETGTVAESRGALWDEQRSDFGVGIRLVTISGGVYRADYVTGDEGPQLTVIVNYPW